MASVLVSPLKVDAKFSQLVVHKVVNVYLHKFINLAA
jgi:hypothetical protein